jgi:hypothetical protein
LRCADYNPTFPFLQNRWPHGNGLGLVWYMYLDFSVQVETWGVYSVGPASPSQQYTPTLSSHSGIEYQLATEWVGDIDTHDHSFIWHVCNADYHTRITDTCKRRTLVVLSGVLPVAGLLREDRWSSSRRGDKSSFWMEFEHGP